MLHLEGAQYVSFNNNIHINHIRLIIIIISTTAPVVEDDSISDSAISDDEAPTNRPQEFSTDSENNLTCCILMLDILLKQMELQDIEQHQGINTHVCDNVCRLLKCMITATAGVKTMGPGSHVCSEKVSQ